jgi:hypothetical protein
MIEAREGQHRGVVTEAGEYKTPCLTKRLRVSGIIDSPPR